MKGINVSRFLFLPGRKLYGFLVEAEPKPGVLSRISAVPAWHDATILYISYAMPPEGGENIVGLSFVDLTDADVSAEELAEEVLHIKGVKDVKVINPEIEGFIADNISGILQIGDDRCIILRRQGYRGLITNIREKFGTGGEAFLYYIGFETGVEYGKSHREIGLKLGVADPVRILKVIGGSLFSCVGFGRAEVVNASANPPEATIRIYDSFECELGLESGGPYSHLIRGMLAGVLTVIFNRRMRAEERKCIASGDPYCEFTIKPA
ncbi:hypothetical protein J7L29_00510 [Candidatus Bathyarchaeota archaeon]|nr:hypothetical protein [Candidatus Bathyarchaeota archaeon]